MVIVDKTVVYRRIACGVSLAFMWLLSSVVWSQNYLQDPQFQQFLGEMEKKHRLDRLTMIDLFSEVTKRDDIIALMERPAEKTKTWGEYRPIFVNDRSLKQGQQFWTEHEDVLAKAAKTYRVPPEIIVAIIGVETRYGQFKGSFRVIEALSTLAFSYPPRADFFRKELEHFLMLGGTHGVPVGRVTGSYAGAMGFPQFMPSSYREYAVDFDQDGKVDLVNSVEDAIGSVGNYFQRHGWQAERPVARPLTLKSSVSEPALAAQANNDLKPSLRAKDVKALGLKGVEEMPEKTPIVLLRYETDQGPEYWAGFDNFYVITRYNRSRLYAMAVFQLAKALREDHKAG